MFVLLFGAANGQDHSYVQYNVKNGLAGSTVYCMTEDKEGFLWIGTETGLSRFDGTRFRNFTTSDGLPDNEILRLFVDSRNRVWIMPFRNSLCYYYNGKIYTKANDSLLNRLKINSEIISINEDDNHNLLILQRSSVTIISPNGHVVSTDKLQGEKFRALRSGLDVHKRFTIFYANEDDEKWLVHVSPFLEVTAKTHFAGNYKSSYTSTVLHPRVQVIRGGDSLFVYHSSATQPLSVYIPEDFNGVSLLNDTLLAINTGKNSKLYDINSRKFVGQFMNGYQISSSYIDVEGNFWFTTLGSGIFRLSSIAFKSIPLHYQNQKAPAHCLIMVDDRLHIGSDNFLLYTFITSNSGLWFEKLQENYSQQRIVTMLNSDQHGLFLGTDGGVVHYTSGPGKMVGPRLSVKSLAIVQDTLYVGTGVNVFRLRLPEMKIIDTIWRERATSVFVDSSFIYIGTLYGLFVLDKNLKKNFLGNQLPQLSQRVSAITNSNRGIIWVATHGGGLIGLKDGKPFLNLTTKNGLSSNICRTLHFDGANLWAGTDKGVTKIDLSSYLDNFSTLTYSSDDGLSSDIINSVVVKDSIVYIASPAGLTFFNEKSYSTNTVCRLRLTSFQVHDQRLQPDSTPLLLDPTQNNVRFEYVGISYKSGGDITYFYRLKGIEDSWKNTKDVFLEYLSLPSGTYELELYAVNKFGVTSNSLRIPFTIDKFFWEKTWFRAFIIALLVLVLWSFVHFRIKAIRRQEAEKQNTARKLAELEQMALKSQMNPHFIFNSLNSIQQYVIEKDILGANRFITEFARLIRMTLELSAKAKVSIAEEREYLNTYLNLEKTRFEDKFKYDFYISPAIDKDNTFIPPMILQPYIENSIRHGVRHRMDSRGMIHIKFEINDEALICIVEDNGVGRQHAAKYKSLEPIEYHSKGMTVTAKRIEMLNKTQMHPIFIKIEDLEDGTGRPSGTRVKLSFPIQEALKSN